MHLNDNETYLDETIIQAYDKGKFTFIEHLEKYLNEFIYDHQKCEDVLINMNAFQNKISNKVCQRYQIERKIVQNPENDLANIVLTKNNDSSIPKFTCRELYEKLQQTNQKKQIAKIIKKQNNNDSTNDAQENLINATEININKEQEYEYARQRILNDQLKSNSNMKILQPKKIEIQHEEDSDYNRNIIKTQMQIKQQQHLQQQQQYNQIQQIQQMQYQQFQQQLYFQQQQQLYQSQLFQQQQQQKQHYYQQQLKQQQQQKQINAEPFFPQSMQNKESFKQQQLNNIVQKFDESEFPCLQ